MALSFDILVVNGIDSHLQLRTLRHFDVWALDPYPNPKPPMNGAAYGTTYVPPKFPGPDIRTEAEKGELKLYTGNCHCGAVMLALKSKPLSEVFVMEDDCSICVRVRSLCLFPLRTQFYFQSLVSLLLIHECFRPCIEAYAIRDASIFTA